MTLPILTLDLSGSSEKLFIDFWAEYYNYSKTEYFYDETIKHLTYSSEDITMLFEWKNGMKFRGHIPKEASVNNVISKLEIVNQLKLNFDQELFDANFKDMSAVWKLFLLHIIDPSTFPIFDQHVYRAHFFIINQRIEEIKESKAFKEAYYRNSYVPFFNSLKDHTPYVRNIDKALWSFGKFLKSPYASKLNLIYDDQKSRTKQSS